MRGLDVIDAMLDSAKQGILKGDCGNCYIASHMKECLEVIRSDFLETQEKCKKQKKRIKELEAQITETQKQKFLEHVKSDQRFKVVGEG